MTDDIDAFVRELEQAFSSSVVVEGRGPVIDTVRILAGRSMHDLVLQIDYHDSSTGKAYSDTLSQFGELLSSMGDVVSFAGLLLSEYDEALYGHLRPS